MKPRYYPHLTVLAAVLLTMVPLSFVLWLSSERSADQQLADSSTSRDRSAWDAQIDATVNNQPDAPAVRPRPPSASPSGSVRSPTTADTHDAAVQDVKLAVAGVDSRSAVAAQAHKPVLPAGSAVTPRMAQPETRFAMRTDHANHRDAPSSFNSVADELDVLTIVPEPPRRPAAPAAVVAMEPALVANNAQAQAMAQRQLEEQQALQEAQRALQMEKEHLNREMQQAMSAPPPTQNQTYYDATGHLAMRAPSVKAPNAADGDKETKKPGNRKSRVNGKTDSETVRQPASADASELTTWLDPENTEAALPEIVEDVILQQPLESRNVGQVENVVAVTRAKGWPIAMVRSDIPDDDWWVQQMVGIRGNAFAARVNFGNEHSIPGSVYHMVIMFLDSPDEVRRFRIAKQFEKLPEGVRRSREFTFVRQ